MPEKVPFIFEWGFDYFQGSQYLPDFEEGELYEIRNWAIEQGLIWSIEDQILDEEQVSQTNWREIFEPEVLRVGVSIDKKDNGELSYLEFPIIPTSYIVDKGWELEIVYWQLTYPKFDSNKNIIDCHDIRLGYCIDGIDGEFCMISPYKRVNPKFIELYNQIKDDYEVKISDCGDVDIEILGKVKAKLSKKGTAYEIEFVY